jgi:hypothetical protein
MNSFSQSDSQRLVAPVAWGLFATVFAYYIGYLVVKMPPISALVAFLPMVFILFFKRPIILITIYLLAIYDGGGILPLDTIFHVPGVGRPTDVFGMMLALYFLLLIFMDRGKLAEIRSNTFYRPLVIMLVYAVFILVYTVVYWHEDPLLAFRVGRRYYVYGFPLVSYFILKNRDAWRWIERICLFLIFLTFAVNILDAMLGLVWVTNLREDFAQRMGVYKAYTQVKALAVLFLGRYLWLYAHQPTRKNFFILAGIAGSFLF